MLSLLPSIAGRSLRDAAPDDAAEQKARRTVYWHVALALLYAAAAVLIGMRRRAA